MCLEYKFLLLLFYSCSKFVGSETCLPRFYGGRKKMEVVRYTKDGGDTVL
jgi:hypothetical protein